MICTRVEPRQQWTDSSQPQTNTRFLDLKIKGLAKQDRECDGGLKAKYICLAGFLCDPESINQMPPSALCMFALIGIGTLHVQIW